LIKFLVLILIFSSFLFPLSYQQEENGNGTTDPWVIDYQFIRDIILILIPTIIGAYTSRHLANKWQENKERAQIKKSIQNEVDESLVHYVMLLINMNRKIWRYYNKITEKTKYKDGRLFNVDFQLPEQPEEQIANKFSKEIDEMFNEISLIDEKLTKLISSIGLYYKDPLIRKQLKNLTYLISPIRLELIKLTSVITEEKFDQYHESFLKLTDEYKIEINKFKANLIKAEISI